MGHLQLIEFAANLPVERVDVLLCTQPHEPMVRERVSALRNALDDLAILHHFDRPIEQNPEAPGFWDTWDRILRDYASSGYVDSNTIVVASEPYGKTIAERLGAKFMPYDIGRQLNPVRATWVRDDPEMYFEHIIPEFRGYLTTRVTLFGAESVGKTTMAKKLAKWFDTSYTFEYARPYLENTVNEITIESMTDIWYGQRALQQTAGTGPVIIQDTDLFSTVGYWQLPHWQDKLGEPPAKLIDDAVKLSSDLYIILPSDIPFEVDPLRYGGDHRESTDQYWIDLGRKFLLPRLILDGEDRFNDAAYMIQKIMDAKLRQIAYDRHGY